MARALLELRMVLALSRLVLSRVLVPTSVAMSHRVPAWRSLLRIGWWRRRRVLLCSILLRRAVPLVACLHPRTHAFWWTARLDRTFRRMFRALPSRWWRLSA